MKMIVKKYLSILLCVTTVLCSTLPSLANANVEQETTESKIVEQLKEDLGEEKALEILKTSENDVDFEIMEEESDEVLLEEEPEEDLDESDENFDESEDNFEVPEDNLENLEDDLEESNAINTLEVESDESFEEESYKNLEDESITNNSEDEVKECSEDTSIFDGANAISERNFMDDLENNDMEIANVDNESETILKENSDNDIDEGCDETIAPTKSYVDEIGIIDIATLSEIDDLEVEHAKFGLNLYGSTNNYILTKDWADGSGISKENVTKLTFQKGGSIPGGTEYDVLNSNGMKGYVNGTEIIIFVPNNDDEIYLTANSKLLFSAYTTGSFNSAPQMQLSEIVNLGYLKTTNVKNMDSMFLGCSNLTAIDLSNFNTSNVQDLGYMFYNCSSLNEIDLSSFNTSNVINMGAMFQKCTSLESIDISNFDYSKIDSVDHTDFSTFNLTFAENASTALMLGSVFQDCTSISEIKLGNVNANHCRNFASMFNGCSSLQTIEFTGFSTNSAISLNYLFRNCSSLTSIDISTFNTTNVKYASFLFFGCSSLTNLNINIQTNSLLSMLSMFYGCSQLTTIDLSSFNTSLVTNTTNTFKNCTNLQTIKVSTNFVISNVTSDDNMFEGCTSLVGGNGTTYDSTKIDKTYARIDADGTPGYFTNGNTSSNEYTLNANWYPTSGVSGITKGLVTKIKFLQSNTEPFGTSFLVGNNADNTKNLNAYINGTEVTILIPNGATLYAPSDSTSLLSMYDGGTQFSSMTKSLTSIENLNLLNTSNVTNMKSMFRFNSNLTSLDVSSFDTSNVTNMSDMFGYCQGLSSIDVSTFNTTNVIDMSRMFQEMRGVTSITLGNIDTSAVNKMRAMFQWCNSLNDIDLIGFNTSSVTDMWGMFDNDNSLTTIYVSTNFVTTSVTDSSQMFNNCSSLVGETGTSYDNSKIDKTYAHIDSTETPGYFTEGSLGTLTGISVRTAPSKLAYISGENFDPTGLVLTLSYDSGKSKSLTYNTSTSADFTFSPDLTTALTTSNTSVSINYSGFSCTQNITVKELSSINVNTAPTKLSYRVGEYFNPAGLKINLVYSDSSTDTVAYQGHESDFTFAPNTSTALTETNTSVTITYAGKTCTQTLTIVTLDTISVITSQTKTKYKVGEFYDPTGLKIRLTYTDSSTEDVVYNDTTKDNFTFTPNLTTALTMSDTGVTIGYANKTCTQNITVIELSTITVKTAPTTLKYAKGSNFNPAGLSIELLYSDNTTKETVAYAGHESDFTFNPSLTDTLDTAGNSFPVTITYKSKSCTQNIQVVELSSIEVNAAPTKVIYNVGETFAPAGLKIKLNYSDGTNQIVAYNDTTASSFNFTPNTALTISNTSITITYAGKTCTQSITIKDLTSITIKNNPSKLSYATGQSLNPSGLVITQNYTKYTATGNTPENIDITYNSSTQNKFSFSPSGTSISTGAVTVTYDGKTGANFNPTFNITVKQVATVSVVSKPSKTSYYNGDTLNVNGLKLKVEYIDNTNETITYSSNYASDFAFSPSEALSLGTNTVNVTYAGKTTSFGITVTTKPSNSGSHSGGSGGGGGGGGGGTRAAGDVLPFTNTSGTTNTQATAKLMANNNHTTAFAAFSNDCTWNFDAVTNSWKLNANANQVANTFFVSISVDATGNPNYSTYYFDQDGNMTVGWVKDAQGQTYFFEDAKTSDEGKMITGWKRIAGIYYYFGADGKMFAGGVTPDGYVVNADGSWTDPNATTKTGP